MNIFFLTKKRQPPNSKFADFFLNAPAKEKKKVIKQAVRQANQDQRDLLKRYEQKFSDSL